MTKDNSKVLSKPKHGKKIKGSKLKDHKNGSKLNKKDKTCFTISDLEVSENHEGNVNINEKPDDNNKFDNYNVKKKNKKKASKMEQGVELDFVGHHPDDETEKEIRVKKKKHKKSKQKSSPDDAENEVEDNIFSKSETKKVSRVSDVSTEYNNEESNWEERVHDSAKNRLHEIKTQPYKPGNLTDLLQIKKYGRLILPYDPSFGLDPSYKIPEWNDPDIPKVHINPLFDLSKRRRKKKFGDGTGETVFVGNLPSNTKIRDLKKIFNNCGPYDPKKLRTVKRKVTAGDKQEPDDQSMYTQIRFGTKAGSKAALELNGILYEGRRLRITLANKEQDVRSDRSIFVGNLPFDTQDDDLWKIFEGCGDIETVRLVRDGRTGRGKGFGFINFKSSDSVAAALQLDGSSSMGRNLRVTKHEARAESLSNTELVKRRHKKRRRHKPAAEDSTNLKQNGNNLKRKSQDSIVQEEDAPAPKKQKKKKSKNKEKRSTNEEPVE